ncbi:hypothetical protein [Parasphingorhabdus sp.]|uniref:hypothetical protein n=1 Tax=Parasphingorhabdus sp. TaxID=2709688 RepID=UPI003265C678
MKYLITMTIGCAALAACSPSEQDAGESAILDAGPEATITKVDDVPEAVRSTALSKIPGMVILEAERKERDGMVFYDVEGTRPDGSEVELDMLEENDGYVVVEVQRDIAWTDVPEDARAAAPSGLFAPVRVIESVQQDGTIIYELFEDGNPKEPSAEIAVKDGKAEMLTERWKY